MKQNIYDKFDIQFDLSRKVLYIADNKRIV